jgi:hypothetical protein
VDHYRHLLEAFLKAKGGPKKANIKTNPRCGQEKNDKFPIQNDRHPVEAGDIRG